MVSTMVKEMEELFAMRFGAFPPRPSAVGVGFFNYTILTRGPRTQSAEIERKQSTAFESDHFRKHIILALFALDCGWDWHFLRLLVVLICVGPSSEIAHCLSF